MYLLNGMYSLDGYMGLMYHNVSASWWKLYHAIIWKDEDKEHNSHQQLYNAIHKLKSKETNGVNFLLHIISDNNLYFGPHEHIFPK